MAATKSGPATSRADPGHSSSPLQCQQRNRLLSGVQAAWWQFGAHLQSPAGLRLADARRPCGLPAPGTLDLGRTTPRRPVAINYCPAAWHLMRRRSPRENPTLGRFKSFSVQLPSVDRCGGVQGAGAQSRTLWGPLACAMPDPSGLSQRACAVICGDGQPGRRRGGQQNGSEPCREGPGWRPECGAAPRPCKVALFQPAQRTAGALPGKVKCLKMQVGGV
jgi:hypothetical protein